MKKLLLVLLLALAACASQPAEIVYVDRIVEVNVPVLEEFPRAERVAKPDFPVNQLPADATAKERAVAILGSWKLLVAYSERLEATLEPYYEQVFAAANSAEEHDNGLLVESLMEVIIEEME